MVLHHTSSGNALDYTKRTCLVMLVGSKDIIEYDL